MPDPQRVLYCAECKGNVPIEELEDGTVIVHCPKCVGECATCDCHLAAGCFDASVRVVVRHIHPLKENT